jgi:hypothetical protein
MEFRIAYTFTGSLATSPATLPSTWKMGRK